MKQIFQLKEEEYNDLFIKVNLNDKQIEQKADELYKKNGTHAISLTVNIGDYEDEIKVVANGYVKDWGSKYPIKEEDKRRIINFMKRRAEELFEGRFGNVIYNINNLKEAKIKFNQRKKLLTTLTYTGWAVALLAIITFYYA